MTVFANGLEVACKAQSNQVIAAFPDVCFTPPENPATPPGIPVPYPSFGMDSDTESGTGTVKIGGQNVTQKNKSYYSKTTGTEAGCAAKKNIITSVNRGKEYAHAWSGNVKMDGEPISRFTDISSNDHASPIGGTPPYPKVGKPKPAKFNCAKLKIKPYNKLKCPPGYEKEHTVEVQFFTAGGVRDMTLKCCEKYDDKKAPCICMKAKWIGGEGTKVKGKRHRKREGTGTTKWSGPVVGKGRYTPHYYKSAAARKWLSDNPNGKLDDFVDTCVNATVKEMDKPKIALKDRAAAAKCLKDANMKYLRDSMGKTADEVKNKKKCHGGCARAKAQAKQVQQTKKNMKKSVVTAADVEKYFTKPTVACTPGAC
ncbi:DUF4150 domain-containing protein [Mesorhizobium sp. SEMIA 3007]|uniref:DUF4150 domain-containing protein n=1 Tax=Mesorhizobium sp. SEMIA 3007 TaxID=1862350 RepID=UPI0009F2FEAC|nr:DUF4150 domain-containing protein [Mesorhizobium sp. SEMIA 3007]